MKLIKAIVRPNKLEEVVDALAAVNVTGYADYANSIRPFV
jgi:nitrogen regulatory protein PII